MILPAALSLGWSTDALMASAQSELDSLASSSDIVSNGVTSMFANSAPVYRHEFGKYMCTVVPADADQGFVGAGVYMPALASLPPAATSLAARNGFVYEVTDVGAQSQPDFFIIDTRISSSSVLVSSLNTGPGLAAIAVAGHYAYVANESSISQLQIIDIADRSHPSMVSSLKLPLPNASSTAPHASAIYYSAGMIFLGTEKWDGPELNIIDVSNPLSPHYLGGFETGTLVNAVYVKNGFAYLAAADAQQLRIVDIHDPADIAEISYFSPTGSKRLISLKVADLSHL
jgi:hypothetical protein